MNTPDATAGEEIADDWFGGQPSARVAPVARTASSWVAWQMSSASLGHMVILRFGWQADQLQRSFSSNGRAPRWVGRQIRGDHPSDRWRTSDAQPVG